MRFGNSALRFIGLLAIVLCWVWSPSAVLADELLRWKFSVGEKLDYSMTQNMNMNMDAGPAGKLVTTARQTMDMTWDVKGVNEQGDAVIEQKIERIRVKMTAPGGQGFEYDSDAEGPAVGMAAMIAPTFEAMTAGEFEFTMSPRGEVRDVHISEELLTAIKNAPGGADGGEEKSVEQFKSMVTQVAFVLPENPPTPGEEWTTKIAVDNPTAGNQTVETTYKYDGIREVDGMNYAVIKPTLKMELAGNPMMEMKMKDQKTDGELLFNLEAGRLDSMTIDQDITLDVVAAGQTMPGTIDQKIEVKVTPAEASTEKPEAAAKASADKSAFQICVLAGWLGSRLGRAPSSISSGGSSTAREAGLPAWRGRGGPDVKVCRSRA